MIYRGKEDCLTEKMKSSLPRGSISLHFTALVCQKGKLAFFFEHFYLSSAEDREPGPLYFTAAPYPP
jgi:hypothetical protein